MTKINKENATTAKFFAEILATGTLEASKHWLEINKVTEIDKQMWAFYALGFFSALHNNGYTEGFCAKVLEMSHSYLEEIN